MNVFSFMHKYLTVLFDQATVGKAGHESTSVFSLCALTTPKHSMYISQ